MSKINLVTDEGEFIVDPETKQVTKLVVEAVEGEAKDKVLKRLDVVVKMDAGAKPMSWPDRIRSLENRLGVLEARLEEQTPVSE